MAFIRHDCRLWIYARANFAHAFLRRCFDNTELIKQSAYRNTGLFLGRYCDVSTYTFQVTDSMQWDFTEIRINVCVTYRYLIRFYVITIYVFDAKEKNNRSSVHKVNHWSIPCVKPFVLNNCIDVYVHGPSLYERLVGTVGCSYTYPSRSIQPFPQFGGGRVNLGVSESGNVLTWKLHNCRY